jgi:hypothetical protein
VPDLASRNHASRGAFFHVSLAAEGVWLVRRTRDVGREEILSRQRAGAHCLAQLGRYHQGTMDLRAGAPAAERSARSRSLRGPILARTESPRTDDDDRLRLPPISPAQNGKTGKKESMARRLNRHCPQLAKPSSNSSPGYRRKDARAAENGFAAKSSVSESAKVVLGKGLYYSPYQIGVGRGKGLGGSTKSLPFSLDKPTERYKG